MSWNPKCYNRRHRPDDEEERCPKCSWAEWETFAWLTTAVVVFYGIVIIIFYTHQG